MLRKTRGWRNPVAGGWGGQDGLGVEAEKGRFVVTLEMAGAESEPEDPSASTWSFQSLRAGFPLLT
jgi:hypothetical protein